MKLISLLLFTSLAQASIPQDDSYVDKLKTCDRVTKKLVELYDFREGKEKQFILDLLLVQCVDKVDAKIKGTK